MYTDEIRRLVVLNDPHLPPNKSNKHLVGLWLGSCFNL